jgi:hypothetical protein
LSTSWDEYGSISDIGTPLQFKEFRDSLGVGLPMTRQLQLLDVKSSVEKLEGLVAECRNVQLWFHTSSASTTKARLYEKHEIISWKSFSIQTHADIMMKPCPDEYGTGRYIAF